MMLLSPAYFASSTATFILFFGSFIATSVCVICCLFGFNSKPYIIEFILPINQLLRGCVKLVCVRVFTRMPCLPNNFNSGLTYLDLSLGFTELLLFRVSPLNYYSALTIFLLTTTCILKPKSTSSLDACSSNAFDVLGVTLSNLTLAFPLLLSFNLSRFNDLKLFLAGEKVTKQEIAIESVFDNRIEGIAVFASNQSVGDEELDDSASDG